MRLFKFWFLAALLASTSLAGSNIGGGGTPGGTTGGGTTGGGRNRTPAPTRQITCQRCNTTETTTTISGVNDPALTSATPPGCSFISVRSPNPTLKRFPFNLCKILANIRQNRPALRPYLPSYCLCTSALARSIISTACGSSFEYFQQYYLARLLYVLQNNNATNQTATRALLEQLRNDITTAGGGSVLTDLSSNPDLRDDTRNLICGCFQTLITFARAYLTRDRLSLSCDIDGPIPGKFAAMTLLDLVSNTVNTTRIRDFCPTRGCCLARVTMTRVLEFNNRTRNDTRTFGGFAEAVIEPVCNRFTTSVDSTVLTCNSRSGYVLVTASSDSAFIPSDPFCTQVKSRIYSNALEAFSTRIDYTAGMCNQANITNRECVDTFVPRASNTDYTSTGTRTRRIIVTASNRNKGFESGTNDTTTVDVNDLGNANDTIGECLAQGNGRLELRSNRTNVTLRLDYLAAVALNDGDQPVVRSRLKKMIVNQRFDLDRGSFEFDNSSNETSGAVGDVECVGVFTAQRGSTLRRVLMRLKNAGVIRDAVHIESGSRILCERDVLMDGSTLTSDGSVSGFELECTGTRATVISGRGTRNVLRVKTKTVTIQVDTNGSISIERDSETKTVVTTAGGILMIRRNTTVVIDDVEGDGDLDIDSDSELQIVRSLRSQLRLQAGARLKIARANGTNITRNASDSADVTEIDADLDCGNGTRIEIIGKRLLAKRLLNLRRLAKLAVAINYDDNLGSAGSPIILAEGNVTIDLGNDSSSIVITIDNQLYCALNKTLLLMRYTAIANKLAFPPSIVVTVNGGTSCGGVMRRRRLLQATSCVTMTNQQTGEVWVDCSGTSSPSASPTTLPPGATGNPTAAPVSPGNPAPTPVNNSRASVVRVFEVFVAVFVAMAVVF